MAARVIHEFRGHSGSQVCLMGKRGNLFVRKTGNFQRNLEQLQTLVDFPVPRVYGHTAAHMDMEYIHGLDMRAYLINNPPEALSEFIIDIVEKFAQQSVAKDYTEVYQTFLANTDFDPLPFTQQQLLDQLPSTLPQSKYHGDLTLENIIFNANQGFYLIDCATGIWDSYVFDIAKLRQDLTCYWFLRSHPAMLQTKLSLIQQQLLSRFTEGKNDALLILMLLRVIRYCEPSDTDHVFLIKEIEKLWKS